LIITIIFFPISTIGETRRQKKNFFAKKGTGIGMECGKGKLGFVKDNIPGDIHSTGRDI
jgi:hypothetical protein